MTCKVCKKIDFDVFYKLFDTSRLKNILVVAIMLVDDKDDGLAGNTYPFDIDVLHEDFKVLPTNDSYVFLVVHDGPRVSPVISYSFNLNSLNNKLFRRSWTTWKKLVLQSPITVNMRDSTFNVFQMNHSRNRKWFWENHSNMFSLRVIATKMTVS